MRGIRNHLPDDIADLGELIHQVDSVVKPARSVNDDHIRIFRNGGLDRVIGHGSGIRAHLLTDNADSGPVSPYLQLLDSSCPECIGCTENHILSLRLEPCGELAYGRGLADAVDSHNKDDIRLFREIERKAAGTG